MSSNEVSNPNDVKSLQSIWITNSIISVFGIILNSLVLLIFFKERNQLVTSVNAMIMYVFLAPTGAQRMLSVCHLREVNV